MKDQFYKHIENLQDSITSKIEEVDGLAKFEEDIWQRQEGGGGRTRVIENGAIFEKGGVNISAVHGELPEVLRNQFTHTSHFYDFISTIHRYWSWLYNLFNSW